jgi:hypothetical protein
MASSTIDRRACAGRFPHHQFLRNPSLPSVTLQLVSLQLVSLQLVSLQAAALKAASLYAFPAIRFLFNQDRAVLQHL